MFQTIIILLIVTTAAWCQPANSRNEDSSINNEPINVQNSSIIKNQQEIGFAEIPVQISDITNNEDGSQTISLRAASEETTEKEQQEVTYLLPIPASALANRKYDSSANKNVYPEVTLGQIIDYLTEAARVTLLQQGEKIGVALNSIVLAGKQNVQAGQDSLKAGVHFILLVPEFGKNVILPAIKPPCQPTDPCAQYPVED